MKQNTRKTLIALTTFAICTASASATVLLTDSLSYSQDFDKAAFTTDMQTAGIGDPLQWNGTASSTQWSQDSTFNGWYRQVSLGSGGTNRQDKDFIGEFKGGTIRYGLTGSSSDDPSETALGVVMQATEGQVSFGAVFEVDAGLSVTGMNISYTGEQWFRGASNFGGTLEFQYKVLDDPFSGILINDETGWTDVNTLDFGAIVTGPNAGKLNGNNGDNQSALSESISLSASESQLIAIRWQYTSAASGAQAGLFIDDFQADFTTVAIPEPSTYAMMLAGLSVVVAVTARRRKR